MDKHLFQSLNIMIFVMLASPVYLKNIGVSTFQNYGDAGLPPDYDVNDLHPITETNIYEPGGAGSFEITKEELTEELKSWFVDSVSELCCSVPSLSKLKEIPKITCEKSLLERVSNNLEKLLKKYEDKKAISEILGIIFTSEVGKKMLYFLCKKLSISENKVKSLVKELWFEDPRMSVGILFPNVFLGFENPDKKSDENIGYPYNRSSVSWTGNNFMTLKGKENFRKGKVSTLVQNSMYLADVEVTLGGQDRNSTFIIGTTFLYDFVTYTVCWIAGAKLDKCVVPLPGSPTVLVDIKPVIYKADMITNEPLEKIISVYCTGFDVFLHTDTQ